jgi:hypothetical protein
MNMIATLKLLCSSCSYFFEGTDDGSSSPEKKTEDMILFCTGWRSHPHMDHNGSNYPFEHDEYAI